MCLSLAVTCYNYSYSYSYSSTATATTRAIATGVQLLQGATTATTSYYHVLAYTATAHRCCNTLFQQNCISEFLFFSFCFSLFLSSFLSIALDSTSFLHLFFSCVVLLHSVSASNASSTSTPPTYLDCLLLPPRYCVIGLYSRAGVISSTTLHPPPSSSFSPPLFFFPASPRAA